MERDIMKKLFIGSFEKNPHWDTLTNERKETIVRKIERNCYNDAVNSCVRDGLERNFKTGKSFVERYQSNCYKILSNIDIESSVNSSYLSNLILQNEQKEINLDTIVELNSYDLCPDASQGVRDEIDLRKQQKIEHKVSHRHTCKKCGHNETVSLEYAPRAADEATVLSLRCIKCNNVWRQY